MRHPVIYHDGAGWTVVIEDERGIVVGTYYSARWTEEEAQDWARLKMVELEESQA